MTDAGEELCPHTSHLGLHLHALPLVDQIDGQEDQRAADDDIETPSHPRLPEGRMGIDDECPRIVLPYAVGIGGTDEETQMSMGNAVERSTVHVVDIVPFVTVAFKLIGISDTARTCIVKGGEIDREAALVARHFQHGRVEDSLRLVVTLVAHTGKGYARHDGRVAQVARREGDDTAIAGHEQVAVTGTA